MKLRFYLLLQALLFMMSTVFAQQQNIRFSHLDIDAGLSQNHILCMLQDSRGFMWFGTRDGLNKYDGYRFTIYKNDIKDKYSISNNFISGIVEDSKGIIWVSTRGGGLNSYDRSLDRFSHYTNNAGDATSVASNLLDGLTKDKDDNLWICTENDGIDFFNRQKNSFIHYRHKENTKSLSNDNTRFIHTDSKQNVWIGGYGGLNYFDTKTKTFTNYTHDPKIKTSLSNNNVRVVFEDSRQRIWIGTVGGGLELLDKETGKFKHYITETNNPKSISANVVAALGEDNEGNIWIGTENGGLDILNPATGFVQVFKNDDIDVKSISQNSIYSIYRDADDNMWVGTYSGGVNVFSKGANKFTHYYHSTSPNSLSNDNVLAIANKADGKLWIGTDGGGLNLFDPVTKNSKHFTHDVKNKNSICGNYIVALCEDSKGNVWIGTWGDGLTVFNPKRNTYKHFKNNPLDPSSISSNDIWTIIEDADKNIWIGSYGEGLNLYNPEKNNFIHFADSNANAVNKQIFCIADDYRGNLLIGTDGGGLSIFNKQKKTFTSMLHRPGDKNSISDNRIVYLHRDSKNNFWINSMSGLNYFDRTANTITTYTTENGLPNNVIFAMAEDNNKKLWVSTNRGLSKFDPLLNKFTNYTPSDGLQSYEFKSHSVCKSNAGVLYFGGINGFNEFNPADIKEENIQPVPVFTSFEIFNKKILIAKDEHDPSPLKKEISETKEITLSYKNSVISFEFASLNYISPEKKQYAYIMEGFDNDWSFIGSKHTATYTNLDPGTYIFKVKVLNSIGQWSSKISSIKLVITPPFWLTWWFKLAVLISSIAVIVALFRFRVKIIQVQKLKLEEKVREQTHQLQLAADEEKKARREAEKATAIAEYAVKETEHKNKELEQFVYIASHDLQEPLRTTTSFVQMLQKHYDGKMDEKADRYFKFIVEASVRMRTLIKDLLEYSRIGSEKKLVDIDCNLILQEVLADLGDTINKSSAVIKSNQLPIVKGYRTEIKQLFQNLINNAIKFRKPGVQPLIKIDVVSSGRLWQFSVKDNGIGIAEEYQEKIFIIFQRLHSKSDYEGSGIGLAHAKKITEIHGGEVWVNSKEGEGTTFYFTLLKTAYSKN